MKKSTKFFGIVALAAVIVITMTACPDPAGGGSSSSNSEKTLIIENVPQPVVTFITANGGELGLFPVGADPINANLVAGNYLPGDCIVSGSGPCTITIPLYNINETRWTGSGTFDIYARWGVTTLSVSSVKISSATTTISFNDADITAEP